ncbi:MAG: alpha/beta hydrolase, partial [Deltaproteobacteria bacterium]|nr:alpha/beta hydrolase [Deltaproteobacteria bacterium]
MIDNETFFVIGKTIDESDRYSDLYLTIAAYSSKFKENERVDTMYYTTAGTHYGLNLPQGAYTLLVFADQDKNKILDQTEIIGRKTIELNETIAPEKGLVHVDIKLTAPKQIDWVESIPMPRIAEPKKSLFYPPGTIRSLADPIFDDNMATIGMYDPASFLEIVHTSFFALEEDLTYKIPVVFVHGIGGSSRAFLPIVHRLDLKRYKPWFFYYPSGGDLELLGNLFYKIFISGKVANLDKKMPMIIVAHSMGGLIVREALNKYDDKSGENVVGLFITIATPFGGHPAAASGEKHGLIVLPAWRDVNPDSRFIRKLYRKPLPESLNHQLIYAYQNPDILKMSENSDGVVPLSSQLYPIAQKQSQDQFGFNSSHTNILEDDEMIAYLLERMDKVENFFPEEFLQYFFLGGYDVDLSDDYSPIVQYFIHHYGKGVMALVNGTLKPFYQEQEDFLRVTRGEKPATTEVEKGWMKF